MARALTAAVVAVAAILACASADFTIPRKQLGGPPSEFASHAIPTPMAAAESKSSALLYFSFEASPTNDGSYSSKQTLPVDSTSQFQFMAFSPVAQAGAMTLQLIDPNGAAVDLSGKGEASFLPNGDSETQFPTTVYTIANPVIGNYTLITTVSGLSQERFNTLMSVSRSNAETHGIVIVDNESSDLIFSHLTSYTNTMRLEDSVGFQVNMYDATVGLGDPKNGVRPAPLKDVVYDAELEILFPDGHIEIDAMHDDGLHGDLLANDGVYGGSFVASELGPYSVQTVLRGYNANGAFLRTAEHLLTVVPNDLALTATASASVDLSKGRLDVTVGVQDQSNGATTYRAYFELHGQSIAGNGDTAIAWSSAIVNPSTDANGASVLGLEVDLKWLLRAGAVGPFTLQNVYVQEVNSMVPVTQAASIPVKFSDDYELKSAMGLLGTSYAGEITEEMRFGVRPAKFANMTAAPANGPTLVLVHGYCATQNPFQTYAEDWTDAVFFLRGGQSMAHDEFAQYVVQFAEQDNGMTKYSLMGHSQGGIVSLHILNYYWTGLDNTQTGRKIQSLASPFQGNSGAGGWAEVLSLLGGCGENYDMTKEGASLWMAGISQASMEYSNRYTTRYPDGLFENCNSAVQLVLSKPNDGTAEQKYATLPYGNNRGETVKQCHIDGMKYPASYWDHTRNAEINSAAARS